MKSKSRAGKEGLGRGVVKLNRLEGDRAVKFL